MKIKKKMKWVVLNAFLAYLCYVSVTTEGGWQFNLFRFVVWLNVIVTIVASTNDAIKETFIDESAGINRYVSGIYDIAMIATLICYGWFFTAVLVMIQSSVEHRIKLDGKE